MIDSVNEFEQALSRIAKREKIAEVLTNHKELSIKDIVDEVRSSDIQERVSHLATELVTREFVIDAKIKNLLFDLQQKVEKKFPEISGVSLVILGSSAHGGREMRKVLGTEQNSDLDLGLTYDPNPEITMEVISNLVDLLDDQIELNASKYNLPDEYHVCEVIGPLRYNTTNLQSINEAEELLRTMDTSHGNELDDKSGERLLLYFAPSIPAGINQKNREQVLIALSNLYKTDHRLWQKSINAILEAWKVRHHLRVKHLFGENTTKFYGIKLNDRYEEFDKANKTTRRIIEGAAYVSSKAMSGPMREILESTGKIQPT